jgi:hypothetical protein
MRLAGSAANSWIAEQISHVLEVGEAAAHPTTSNRRIEKQQDGARQMGPVADQQHRAQTT